MIEKFKALPDAAQKDILDRHRDDDVQEDWWDSVYDNFKERMETIGICVDQMYFSGFCSQGDGACFEGEVDDWPKFLDSIKALSCFQHQEVFGTMSFSVTHRGHYYHSNSTSYSELIDLSNPYEEGLIRYYVFDALIDECNANVEELWDSCREAFKDHMDDLYEHLEAEYDYFTSDEHVLESLNDCGDLEGEINDYYESTAESTEENLAEI